MPFVDMYMQDVQQLSISGTVVSNDYVHIRNFAELWVRADGAKDSVDRNGLTRFWVMRATKDKETMPANAVADLNMAEVPHLFDMVAGEGKDFAAGARVYNSIQKLGSGSTLYCPFK